MSSPDSFPSPKIIHGEIMPHTLQRGETHSIDAEISDEVSAHEIRKKWNMEHGGGEREPVERIASLRAMQDEGFTCILRLPRVNEDGCKEKYGDYYNTYTWYFEFIDTLARRNGISRFKHVEDDYYVFDVKEDAELLKRKLVERQENAQLEFEVIDGGNYVPIVD